MQSFHFLPGIYKPTRFSNLPNVNPSALDHIWSNTLTNYVCGIISLDITDHLPVFVSYPGKFNNDSDEKIKISFRNHNEKYASLFYSKIHEFNWHSLFSNDVSIFTNNFLKTTNHLYCNTFPLCTKFISKKRLSKPWMNNYLLNLIKLKSEYFKSYRRGLISVDENNRLKNKITMEIRKAKKNYYYKMFDKFKSDLRKTWDTIKSILDVSNNKNTIRCILFNNVEYIDELSIAHIFNCYFGEVASNLESNIPHSSFDPLSLISPNESSMFLAPVTVEECSTVISNLNKSKCGLHNIPIYLIKSYVHLFSPIITEIINNCFHTGQFPDPLKIASITPVHKKGNKKLVSNHRPISVLPYLSKNFEKLILNRIRGFTDHFSLINSCQFGFQKNKSTAHAMIKLVDYFYTSLNNKDFTIAVFVDYQKTFIPLLIIKILQ